LITGYRRLKSKAVGSVSSGIVFKRRKKLAANLISMEEECIKVLVRSNRMSRLNGRIILKWILKK
jgi:hypothetical protein